MPQVSLSLPGAPEYVSIARLTAAGVATRAGLAVDAVEDLRIAVDELCFVLLDGSTGTGSVELTFTIGPDEVTVDGHHHGDSTEGATQVPELSRQILAAVTDSFETVLSNGHRSFRLTKRIEAVGA